MEEFLRIGGRDKRAAGGKGIDFDELGVNDIVELLRNVNVQAVIADFGRERPGEDPVIHFYEYFMAVYDKKEKVRRGVFYTPRPIVSFIVRSVDEVLREEFGLPLGLADTTTWGEMAKRNKDLEIPAGATADQHFVQILDPATGTGTFLVETIDLIHRRMVQHWKGQKKTDKQIAALWNEYVPEHLLARLYGFELMMAPYAIAHMKIGLKLADTGYRFRAPERLRVFLTNSLEPPTDLSEMLEFVAPFLAHEARAASAAKKSARPTVVIGNPPYANAGRQNRNKWILGLLDEYKHGLNERKLNLDDDFIKFMRFSQWTLSQVPVRVLGVITNHVFYDGVTHRRMRQSLLETFPSASLLNLHGNARRAEGQLRADDNVFDIQQGVAITIAWCSPQARRRTVLAHLWGERQGKYSALDTGSVTFTDISEASHTPPEFIFGEPAEVPSEYRSGIPLDELFRRNGQGIQTKRDTVAIQPTSTAIEHVVEDLQALTAAQFAARYDIPVESASWSVKAAKADISEHAGKVVEIAVRPFDTQWTYYSGRTNGFHARPRRDCTEAMLRGTIAILAKRQSKEAAFSSVFVVRRPVNEGFFAIDPMGRETLFPLEWDEDARELLIADRSNLSSTATSLLSTCHPAAVAGADILHFVYAQLHSNVYRVRYAHALRRDYPRVFPSRSEALAAALSQAGADLVSLHLLDHSYPAASWTLAAELYSNPFARVKTAFHGTGDREVRRIGEKGKTMAPSPKGPGFDRVYINDAAYFDGVPEAVWKFHIGGYQVCYKWLADRKGRVLTEDDIAHYHKIVIALNETIRIMGEIDKVIDEHGGWPGAFVTDSGS